MTTTPTSAHPEVLRMAAFTDDPAGGNPAGVVLDAADLDETTMLAIAADLGYSETAFVIPAAATEDATASEVTDSADGGADGTGDAYRAGLRYFSPVAEVAFCGHATIATAVALAARRGPRTIHFTTPAGPVPVTTTQDGCRVTAMLTSPPGRSAAAPTQLVVDALAALGWHHEDLDPDLPPHVAHAGNDHLILNVGTRGRLAQLDYDVKTLRALMEEHGLTTVHLSWRASDNEFHARDPFPVGGIYEDPATGAAAAAFGAYLNILNGPHDATFTIHQGEDMGRPSLLHVTTRINTTTIEVSGTAVTLD
ncbi:PhzF family phenazine biosynthesis protein [Kocuria marina]|uniref:PhzF family phenazine biosynthesis protein n=1 Tax=Kocuria marina TaxID=223184 RepID=UPI003460C5B2